jgi:hypothetical protein
MNSIATLSPRTKRTYKAIMLLFMVGFVGCHVGSCGNVRPVARRTACEANLKKIGAALEQYVATHGNLPRNSKGQVSIVDALNDPEIQKEVGTDSSVLQCSEDVSPNGSSYMFNPALTVSDIASDSTTVVACDKQPRHPGFSPADSPASVMLLGNGAVRIMHLPTKERERWSRLFLSGDKRASKYPEDGNWYTGAPDQQNTPTKEAENESPTDHTNQRPKLPANPKPEMEK